MPVHEFAERPELVDVVDGIIGQHHLLPLFVDQFSDNVIFSEYVLYRIEAADRLKVSLPHEHRLADNTGHMQILVKETDAPYDERIQVEVFKERSERTGPDAPDNVRYQPHTGITHVPCRFFQVVLPHHYIAVADQDLFIFCLSTGRHEVVDLGVQSRSAVLDENGDIAFGMPGLYLLHNLMRSVVRVLQCEDDLVGRVLLDTEAGQIVKKIVIKSLEGFDDRDRGEE
jgi:hypothetical protein